MPPKKHTGPQLTGSQQHEECHVQPQQGGTPGRGTAPGQLPVQQAGGHRQDNQHPKQHWKGLEGKRVGCLALRRQVIVCSRCGRRGRRVAHIAKQVLGNAQAARGRRQHQCNEARSHGWTARRQWG